MSITALWPWRMLSQRSLGQSGWSRGWCVFKFFFTHGGSMKPVSISSSEKKNVFVKPTDQALHKCGSHPYRLEWRDQAFKMDQYFQACYWVLWRHCHKYALSVYLLDQISKITAAGARYIQHKFKWIEIVIMEVANVLKPIATVVKGIVSFILYYVTILHTKKILKTSLASHANRHNKIKECLHLNGIYQEEPNLEESLNLKRETWRLLVSKF